MKATIPAGFLVLLLVTALLPAQTIQVVPGYLANKDGNSSGAYPFGYTTCRTQQVVTASALCRVSALLTGLAMRRDGTGTGNMLARQVPNFKVELGTTTASPGSLNTTFAANRTGTMTTVFSGNYNLPANPPANPGPFNIKWTWTKPVIFLANQGNLLIDITAPGTVGKSSYFVDQETITPGTPGRCSSYGTPGVFAGKDAYTVACPGGGAGAAPGGQLALEVKGLNSQYPNMAFFGQSNQKFGPLTLPFSLAPLGAPGNSLYAEMLFLLPVNLTAQGSTWEGTVALPIPSDPLYTGLTLYGQALFVDPPSNNLGLVASGGVAVTTGSPLPPFQMVANYNAANATGTLQGRGAVLQLTGVFN